MYEKKVKLQDNEIPARYNTETGEIIKCHTKSSNIPDDFIDYKPDEGFIKSYVKVWKFLGDNLTNNELAVVTRMSTMIEYNTNSLNPLDDTTSIRNLAMKFGISSKSVKKIFKKLFDMGVYLSVHYSHRDRGEVKEWVFNPYIATKGRFVSDTLMSYFNETDIAGCL